MPGVINKTSIWPEQIVHEDNHILIINKLPSEIVQGDKTGDLPLSEKIKTFLISLKKLKFDVVNQKIK